MMKLFKYIQLCSSLIFIALVIILGKLQLNGSKDWLFAIGLFVAGGSVLGARNLSKTNLSWQFFAYLLYITAIFQQILFPNLISPSWTVSALSIILFLSVVGINGISMWQNRPSREAEAHFTGENSKERWLLLQLKNPKMRHTLKVLQTNQALIKDIEELYRMEKYLIGGSVPIVIPDQLSKMNTSEYYLTNQHYDSLLNKVSRSVSDAEENLKEYSQWISGHLYEIIQLNSRQDK